MNEYIIRDYPMYFQYYNTDEPVEAVDITTLAQRIASLSPEAQATYLRFARNVSRTFQRELLREISIEKMEEEESGK